MIKRNKLSKQSSVDELVRPIHDSPEIIKVEQNTKIVLPSYIEISPLEKQNAINK